MTSSRLLSLLPSWRHENNPSISSPLSNMYQTRVSSAPGSPPESNTPTRQPRSAEQTTRPRAESRSTSVPTIKLPRETLCRDTLAAPNSAGLPSRNSSSSVKHLTCFWWKDRGGCRHSDEDCLYAHYDTGRYTDPPRTLVPGEPAKAGRSLDRALHDLGITGMNHRSSASINSLLGRGANLSASRPETPGLEMRPINAHTPQTPGSVESYPMSMIQDNNALFSRIIHHNMHETNVHLATIERLSTENDSLKAALEAERRHRMQYEADKKNVVTERDYLRTTVQVLQTQNQALNHGQVQAQAQAQFHVTPSPRATSGPVSGLYGAEVDLYAAQNLGTNPFGAVGSNRVISQPQGRVWSRGITHTPYDSDDSAQASPERKSFM